MTDYLTVTVPVEGKDNKTSYRRVGVAFRNKPGSKAAFSIKLDFPMGATELVLFEPRARDDRDDDVTE